MNEIVFGTDGWRATLDTFTEERVRIVAQAAAEYFREQDATTVGVGYDARETSPRFARALTEVLAGNGLDVVVSERDCPTPVLAWTLKDRQLDGGLVVTASHNPPEYNGVKFLSPDGSPAGEAITDRLESLLAEPDLRPEAEHGTVSEENLVPEYIRHALAFTEADITGLSVAYDAMHGSGRDVTDALLAEAGADVQRLRCELDPTFGGGSPEPTADKLDTLVERVTEGDAELGFANDGDADRLAVVTPGRGFLDPNLLYAALYEYLLESDGGPAVRTVSTTFLVDKIAAAHGEETVEVPVGFKWVAQGMQDAGALCGGEESGGFGITRHLRNKDGVLIALVVAAAHTERPLDDRVDAITAAHGDIYQDRISVDCPDDRKAAVLDELDGSLPETILGVSVDRVDTKDGFKIFLADGSWLLVRPSGTEPKLRVYAEADSESHVEELLDAGRDIVEPLV
ncbi:phosphoglucomutase/phosphomannomutase family protein [Halomicroarcula sp. F13]|uniref:Phosphoglucomutase/phosphomannomutase family protein n=1 Tax=Haloarcula rubra TaxID=2487747 RepID=A0AAW4PLM3_9EURY|nr:phosphoglucomutase/phosphomannomutase family protein [Halomicroarcula rubra]MBX0322024.1 phosphoglucomutase/phosphomannomutase family protein [Halomicroarcula rubra]